MFNSILFLYSVDIIIPIVMSITSPLFYFNNIISFIIFLYNFFFVINVGWFISPKFFAVSYTT